MYLHSFCSWFLHFGIFCFGATTFWIVEKITVYWSVLCTILSNETFHWNTHFYENILLWVCLFWYNGICSVYGSFIHSLDLMCKINLYNFHSSVSIFVLLNYWSDLDNVWCVGLWRSYKVSGAVPVLAQYAFMAWTGTTLYMFIIAWIIDVVPKVMNRNGMWTNTTDQKEGETALLT